MSMWVLDTPIVQDTLTRLKLCQFRFELDRPIPGDERPGYLEFYLAYSYQGDGFYQEPPIPGIKIRIEASEPEYIEFLTLDIPSPYKVSTLARVILEWLGTKGLIPPGQLGM